MFLSISLPTEGKPNFKNRFKAIHFPSFHNLCFHTGNSLVLAGMTKMLAAATDECHCFREHLCDPHLKVF